MCFVIHKSFYHRPRCLSLTNRLRSVDMFATNLRSFSLFLIFVAVSQAVWSIGVNKTAADGKVFITGDHNEVVVSTAQETKITLAEIKSKLQSLSTKNEELTRKLQVLDEKLEEKLNLVNKSNAVLSLQIQVMSQKLQTSLEKQGMQSNVTFLAWRSGTSPLKNISNGCKPHRKFLF